MRSLTITSCLVLTIVGSLAFTASARPPSEAEMSFFLGEELTPEVSVCGRQFYIPNVFGPTGMTGWINGPTLVVREVEVNSPAGGIALPNDVILSVNGKPLAPHGLENFAVLRTLGEQVEASEQSGKMDLLIKRGGKQQTITIPIRKLGAFGKDWPFDCAKSRQIHRDACDYLASIQTHEGMFDGRIYVGFALNGLTWLALEDPKYHDAARRLAYGYRRHFDPTHTSTVNWEWGYMGVFLAEYYLQTGDDSVKPLAHAVGAALARSQLPSGSWGHGPFPAPGYVQGGALNNCGLVCWMALVLLDEAGVEVSQGALRRATRFFNRFTHRGGVPYGDHRAGGGGNGKNAIPGVVLNILGDKAGSEYFARLVTCTYDRRNAGHTGGFMGFIWGNVQGAQNPHYPDYRRMLEHWKWLLNVCRRWDGGILVPESVIGKTYTFRGPVLSTGGLVQVFAMPNRVLRIHGGPKSIFAKQELPADLAKGVELYKKRQFDQLRKTVKPEGRLAPASRRGGSLREGPRYDDGPHRGRHRQRRPRPRAEDDLRPAAAHEQRPRNLPPWRAELAAQDPQGRQEARPRPSPVRAQPVADVHRPGGEGDLRGPRRRRQRRLLPATGPPRTGQAPYRLGLDLPPGADLHRQPVDLADRPEGPVQDDPRHHRPQRQLADDQRPEPFAGQWRAGGVGEGLGAANRPVVRRVPRHAGAVAVHVRHERESSPGELDEARVRRQQLADRSRPARAQPQARRGGHAQRPGPAGDPHRVQPGTHRLQERAIRHPNQGQDDRLPQRHTSPLVRPDSRTAHGHQVPRDGAAHAGGHRQAPQGTQRDRHQGRSGQGLRRLRHVRLPRGAEARLETAAEGLVADLAAIAPAREKTAAREPFKTVLPPCTTGLVFDPPGKPNPSVSEIHSSFIGSDDQPADDKPPIAERAKYFGHFDSRIRQAASFSLLAEGKAAMPYIIKALQSDDVRVIRSGCDAIAGGFSMNGLGRDSSKGPMNSDVTGGAVPHLLPLVKHEDMYVRAGALMALSKCGKAAAKHLDQIVIAADDEDWWVRAGVAYVLGSVAEPQSGQFVESTVRNFLKERSIYGKNRFREALSAMAKRGHGTDAIIEGLVKDTKSPNAFDSSSALTALSQIGPNAKAALGVLEAKLTELRQAWEAEESPGRKKVLGGRVAKWETVIRRTKGEAEPPRKKPKRKQK